MSSEPKLTTKIETATLNSSSYNWDGHGFIARNPENEVMVHVHRVGAARPGMATGTKIAFARSTDKGRTWKNLSGVDANDPEYDPTVILMAASGWDYNNFNGGYTPSGRLIITGRRIKSPFNSTSDIFNFCIYSDDDGSSWSDVDDILDYIDGVDLDTWGVNSSLIILEDGRIAIAGCGGKYTTFPSLYYYRTVFLISDDYDNTHIEWTCYIIHERDPGEDDWKASEPSIADLGSGYILCLSRDEGTNRSNSYRQFVSEDYGENWNYIGVTGFVTVTSGGTKRPATIYPVQISGVKLVACYYGVAADEKIKVVYGLARDLIGDESAWNNDTILELYEGSYPNLGYQTAVHEPGRIDSIIALTDELSSSNSRIKLVHLNKYALGCIISEILNE